LTVTTSKVQFEATASTRRFARHAVISALVLLGIGVGALLLFDRSLLHAEVDAHRSMLAEVRRVEIGSTLTVPGNLGSALNTLIECEIERMTGSERESSANRYSTLLSVIPEGSYVQPGDLLCEIDASGFIEQARRQQIAVDVARTDLVRAKYDLEAAWLALREYVNGIKDRDHTDFQGRIALARANLERQEDRLDWARQVLPLGSISTVRMAEEEEAHLRAQLALDASERAYEMYKRYTEPHTIRSLTSRVEQLESTLVFAERRSRIEEESLALYERQVKACQIRAPHEGYVIYCVDDEDPPIAPGVVVRRHMDLFELPDLSQLEVRAQVNQALIQRIKIGMPARIRLDIHPDRIFEGRVIHIAALPDVGDRRSQATGVSNFLVRVAVDTNERILPGLSAQVEIQTDLPSQALVIPVDALTIEKGEQCCYVANARGFERRAITVEPGTEELLRVTSGLSEGDRVLVDPRVLRESYGTTAPWHW
jgi:HlyD family secretion protein